MESKLLEILIIDDDVIDIEHLQRLFAQIGLQNRVKALSDPDKAMAYLTGEGEFGDRDVHPIPDLLLLDLNMRKIHGFTFLSRIRALEELRDMLVIVETGSELGADVQKAFKLGADSYLVKPVNVQDLLECVAEKGVQISLHRQP